MDLISTVPDDLPPRYGSDRSPTAIARVVSLIEGGRALNVSLYGGPPIQISATAVNWTGVETAHVLLDPDTGRALHALGPAPKPENPLPKWEQLTAPTRSVREAVLIPQWAGTWDGTAWTRHGGGGAWQRNTGGPRLTGLATYGRQAEALGRITVTAATPPTLDVSRMVSTDRGRNLLGHRARPGGRDDQRPRPGGGNLPDRRHHAHCLPAPDSGDWPRPRWTDIRRRPGHRRQPLDPHHLHLPIGHS